MFNKILLAYNGSREGKSALLACAEIAKFAKSETHLLAVAGMPRSSSKKRRSALRRC